MMCAPSIVPPGNDITFYNVNDGGAWILSSSFEILNPDTGETMSMIPNGPTEQPGAGAYELGRMAEALANNTRTLAKLADLVESHAQTTSQHSARLSRIESSIEMMQSDIRKTVNMSMTGHTNESDVRERLAFLDRMYQQDQERQGLKRHGRNVLYGAIVVALFWWGFAAFKTALVNEFAAEAKAQTQTARSK
jgi:hypothetical protein